MQTFDTALVLSELFALEGRLDREQAKANKLAKEMETLARQLENTRARICTLLKEMEGSE